VFSRHAAAVTVAVEAVEAVEVVEVTRRAAVATQRAASMPSRTS
jgi:hypothetical protein